MSDEFLAVYNPSLLSAFSSFLSTTAPLLWPPFPPNFLITNKNYKRDDCRRISRKCAPFVSLLSRCNS